MDAEWREGGESKGQPSFPASSTLSPLYLTSSSPRFPFPPVSVSSPQMERQGSKGGGNKPEISCVPRLLTGSFCRSLLC